MAGWSGRQQVGQPVAPGLAVRPLVPRRVDPGLAWLQQQWLCVVRALCTMCLNNGLSIGPPAGLFLLHGNGQRTAVRPPPVALAPGRLPPEPTPLGVGPAHQNELARAVLVGLSMDVNLVYIYPVAAQMTFSHGSNDFG